MTQPATAAEDKSIRPFQIKVPEEQLADLRRRIEATEFTFGTSCTSTASGSHTVGSTADVHL